jgi:ATP-dependent DNA ligase
LARRSAAFDGRLIRIDRSRVTLLSRNDTGYTKTFADIAANVARLGPRTLLLDGEAVAFDPKRLVSSFQLLQNGS